MFTTIAMKRGALALLLASAVVGAAEAQTLPPDASRSGNCTGGLFTLTDGTRGSTSRWTMTARNPASSS